MLGKTLFFLIRSLCSTKDDQVARTLVFPERTLADAERTACKRQVLQRNCENAVVRTMLPQPIRAMCKDRQEKGPAAA